MFLISLCGRCVFDIAKSDNKLKEAFLYEDQKYADIATEISYNIGRIYKEGSIFHSILDGCNVLFIGDKKIK
jgi:hypothetical protein